MAYTDKDFYADTFGERIDNDATNGDRINDEDLMADDTDVDAEDMERVQPVDETDDEFRETLDSDSGRDQLEDPDLHEAARSDFDDEGEDVDDILAR